MVHAVAGEGLELALYLLPQLLLRAALICGCGAFAGADVCRAARLVRVCDRRVRSC
jgi:hypothetical protein